MRTGNGPEAARGSERVERADWALRQQGVRTQAKLVLVVMAMDAQHRDGITLAGPQTVAERSGMRECEAEHALLALEHQGMVEVLDTRARGGPNLQDIHAQMPEFAARVAGAASGWR